jgi:hypothetical protein
LRGYCAVLHGFCVILRCLCRNFHHVCAFCVTFAQYTFIFQILHPLLVPLFVNYSTYSHFGI